MERVRMVQTSQGWANVPTASVKRDWTIGVLQFVTYDHYRANGFNVVDVNTGSAVKFKDFHGTRHYPNKYSDLADIADAMEID